MVDIRGGLEALGWDGALAMILSVYVYSHDFCGLPFRSPNFSADVISATITFSRPRLDCPTVSSSNLDAPFTVPPNTNQSLEGANTALLNCEVYTLIRSISELASRYLEHSSSFTYSTAAIIRYIQILTAIEHRLLFLPISPSSAQPSDVAVLNVIEISRIAALISTTYYFRSMRITSATISSLQKRLVTAIVALEAVGHDFLDASSIKLLLWACWIGGLTAKDQDWFAIRIYGYMTWIKLYDWRELESYLDGFVLAPRRHDVHGGRLWQRVSQCQHEISAL
jgi:hypothetical protein